MQVHHKHNMCKYFYCFVVVVFLFSSFACVPKKPEPPYGKWRHQDTYYDLKFAHEKKGILILRPGHFELKESDSRIVAALTLQRDAMIVQVRSSTNPLYSQGQELYFIYNLFEDGTRLRLISNFKDREVRAIYKRIGKSKYTTTRK